MRVVVQLPKVHGRGSTPVDVYMETGVDAEDACCLLVDDWREGMGVVTQVWTTRAGLEALRDKLNAVLVQTDGAS